MPSWDLLLTDLCVATLDPGLPGYGEIEDAAIAIRGERIDWVGPRRDLPAGQSTATRSLAGRWVTPALIDCHTHLVFAGDRSGEFEARLEGVSYEDIARAGGGILNTVRATRAATADELFELALPRIRALAAEGVATVEIKSGYGLDIDTEMRMLEVARRLATASGITVCTTLLAAHTVPPEYRGRADDYIDFVCDEILPRAAARQLADAVDAYCESIAFDAGQVARLFERAAALGLRVKLHADQLSDTNGAALAARFGALSADHLEYTNEDGVKAMARAGSVAVLLPAAFLTLAETQQPPLAALRTHGVPIAVASDVNPGTAPICSLRNAMLLASRLFRLTPLECLAGTTRNAATALGLDDRGVLGVGRRADIAAWDIAHPRELSYWMGTPQLAELFVAGKSWRA